MIVVYVLLILIFIMSIINTVNIYLTDCDHHTHPKESKGYFKDLTIQSGNLISSQLKGKLIIMALSMTDTQQAVGTLSFVDKKGAPTDATSVELTVADTNIATATYDDPNNKITIVAGQPGVTALTIVAKNSQGVQLPFDDVAIEITAGDAVSGTVSFETPTEQP